MDQQSGIFLSFQRLSFRDLSNTGSQPMHSSNGRYIIMFNGEIYNFDHLISLLSLKNDHIKSDTD